MRVDQRRRRGVLASATALLALVALAAPAAVTAAPAPQPAAEGLQVTPARVEQDLDQRRFDVAAEFRNADAAPVTLTFEVRGLGHDLDGNPTLVQPAGAARRLRIDTSTATLAPGATRRVRATGDIAPGEGGTYAAVVATTKPGGRGTLSVRRQIGSILLLRGPKPWKQTFEVRTVEATGSAGGPGRLTAVVANTGNVHGSARGRARIVHEGAELAVVDLPGGTVLPGYARRIAGNWAIPAGLTGPFIVEVTLDGMPGTVTRTVELGQGPTRADGDSVTAGGDEGDEKRNSRGASWLGLLLLLAVLAALLATLAVLVRRRRQALAALDDQLDAIAAELGDAAGRGPREASALEQAALDVARAARSQALVGRWPGHDVVARATDLAAAARASGEGHGLRAG